MSRKSRALPVRAEDSQHTQNNGKQEDFHTEVKDHEVHFTVAERHYRIRGLEKNTTHGQLKVNILATRQDAIHLDTLDLYTARLRRSFIKAASEELCVEQDVIKRDIGRILLALEQLQDEQILGTLTSRTSAPELTEAEQAEAMQLLQDPKLTERIVSDLQQCGFVGEQTNKLAGYLAATSRKLDKPLAVVVQSSSSAGKTSLMEAILTLMPEEEVIKYSAMTGQSLFYMGQENLKHKILAVAEEEGVQEAAYALKLLQSEGELRMASASKQTSGRLASEDYHVEGPVMIFLTTTSSDVDFELINRCLVLAVSEDRQQTQEIHKQQRESRTLEGRLAARSASKLVKLHQNAQRLLRPLVVVNPYARKLTFLDDKTRTRRDHEKYLNLIDAIALLHQHQRPLEKAELQGETLEYIEVTCQDIVLANKLASEVLGRTLDELSPQTRRLLLLVHEFVGQRSREVQVERSAFRFTRRELREATGWSDFQVRTHLGKLVQLEYLLPHRGRRGQQYVYELLYDGEGQEGEPFLMGLIDPEQMNKFEHSTAYFEHAAAKQKPPIEPPTSPH